MNRKRQPPDEGLIQILAQVRRQDGDAFVLFHFLQQIGNLHIGIAVVGIAHLGALAEECVGFIEK